MIAHGISSGNPVAEIEVAFLARELLQTLHVRLVTAFHRCIKVLQVMLNHGIIHGDIKPDNIMLCGDTDRLTATGDNDPSVLLLLLDWERGMIVPTSRPVLFVGDSQTDCFRCPSMREGNTWCWEADLFSAASSIYFSLFGNYMDVQSVRAGFYRFRGALKRYWNRPMWENILISLINFHGTNGEAQNVLEQCTSLLDVG